jgi:deoxyribodipyrimidine photo-lyase
MQNSSFNCFLEVNIKLVKPIIVLVRKELRLKDNPLFIYAESKKQPVIPVFIYDNDHVTTRLGDATKLWLRESLRKLKLELKKNNLDLVIREGNVEVKLSQLINETEASEIVCSRSLEPNQENYDKKMFDSLIKIHDIKITSLNTTVLFNPDSIKNKSGSVFKVFTPYYKHCLTLVERDIVNNYIKQLRETYKFGQDYDFTKIESINPEEINFGLNNYNKWQDKLIKYWTPGEIAAVTELTRFIEEAMLEYLVLRDYPSLSNTSKLSCYLNFGEISPFRIWYEVTRSKSHDAFLRQLIWREFANYILYNFPFSADKNLNKKFDDFPWLEDEDRKLTLLKLWQRGLTGYPIVDAGMRELWETGWMHNRVRMIVGSFLVKDLLIPWQDGAKWFWDTLFDADMANNSMGWQWVAGSGVDASPYFRIFNPTLQGEKFDKNGDYIRRWCPELSELDNKWIHKPFEAPVLVLEAASIHLGENYPKPIVNHHEARDKALALFKSLR